MNINQRGTASNSKFTQRLKVMRKNSKNCLYNKINNRHLLIKMVKESQIAT